MNKIKLVVLVLGLSVPLTCGATGFSFSIGSKEGRKTATPEQLQKHTDALKALKESAPREAFDKLSPEQTERVLMAAIRGATKKEDSPAADAIMLALLLTFVLSSFTIPMTLRNRRFKELQATMRLMIEKGLVIPDELIESGVDGSRVRRDARRGVLLLGLGVGLMIFLLVQSSASWGLGWIPLGLGAASLYLSRAEK